MTKKSGHDSLFVGIAVVVVIVIATIIFLSSGKGDNIPANDTGSSSSSSGVKYTVLIKNFAFSPSTLTITVGDTVTWKNTDGMQHSITSDSGSELNSVLLSKAEEFHHTFNTTGTYIYHCKLHSGMVGTIVVK